jgi:hypothetical protein
MKQFKVKIKGLTPYMQHRMDDQKLEEWEKCRKQIIERPEVSQADAARAEYHCYRNTEGLCYIPADHLRNSLINAGTYMKSKVGGRSKSMKVIVAATFVPTPEQILITDYDVIDKRSTVNRNVKARVITIRPKWTNWEAEFTLNVYEPSITAETVTQLINYAGSYVGIGSYRPTNNGMFGRFELENIETI